MATLVVCAVYDRMALVYGRPMVVSAQGLAIRSFIDEVNRRAEGNTMYDHPEDFQLFRIGSYDDNVGELIAIKPELMMAGSAAADMRSN